MQEIENIISICYRVLVLFIIVRSGTRGRDTYADTHPKFHQQSSTSNQIDISL